MALFPNMQNLCTKQSSLPWLGNVAYNLIILRQFISAQKPKNYTCRQTDAQACANQSLRFVKTRRKNMSRTKPEYSYPKEMMGEVCQRQGSVKAHPLIVKGALLEKLATGPGLGHVCWKITLGGNCKERLNFDQNILDQKWLLCVNKQPGQSQITFMIETTKGEMF